jgi:hypothetical protein
MANNSLSLIQANSKNDQLTRLPEYLVKEVDKQILPSRTQMQAIHKATNAAIDHFAHIYGHGMYKTLEATTGAAMLMQAADKVRGCASPQLQAAYEEDTALLLATVHALEQVSARQFLEVASQVPKIETREPTIWEVLTWQT